jgi:uncharacterized protein (DUF1501 family)
MMTRRDLFRAGMAAGGFGLAAHFSRFGLLNAYAPTSGDYRALVCVFLFGGNDSNNTIVPMDAKILDAYTAIRQNLALAATTLNPVETAAKAPYGFHVQLKDVASLWTAGHAAVVANVGSLVQPVSRADYIAGKSPVPSNLFSHSDQQMQWQTSVPSGIATSGWGGRAADQVAFMNGSASFPTVISVSGNAIFGSGDQTRQGSVIPNAQLGLKGYDSSAAAAARKSALEQLLTLDSGVTLIQQASRTMANGINDAETLSKALSGATPLKTVFPATNIANQLKEVAQLIQASSALGMSRQIFFCSLGGFDTHTNQLNDQNTLYGQLGPALGAFFAATQELGVDQQVTAFTESDFSRTLQPNSNGGTDHAWGSHHIVMGGAVKGGDMYGQFPAIALGSDNDSGSEGRWIPTTSIDQYGATLATWFGVPADKLDTVFPNLKNFGTKSLGFLG